MHHPTLRLERSISRFQTTLGDGYQFRPWFVQNQRQLLWKVDDIDIERTSSNDVIGPRLNQLIFSKILVYLNTTAAKIGDSQHPTTTAVHRRLLHEPLALSYKVFISF